jgi:hypothetical protein
MAKGLFSSFAVPEGWFDETAKPEGWFDNDLLDVSAQTGLSASANFALAPMLATATGSLTVAGSVSTTLAGVFGSGSSSLSLTGQHSGQLAPLALSAVAQTGSGAALSISFASLSLSGNGSLLVRGSVGVALSPLTAAGSSTNPKAGSLSATLGAVGLLATGELLAPVAPIIYGGDPLKRIESERKDREALRETIRDLVDPKPRNLETKDVESRTIATVRETTENDPTREASHLAAMADAALLVANQARAYEQSLIAIAAAQQKAKRNTALALLLLMD